MNDDKLKTEVLKRIKVVLGNKDLKKHSVRYNSEDPRLKSIYIPKEGLEEAFGEFPEKVTVTITKVGS